MPAGFSLYTEIHKGQRMAMFRISNMAGTIDLDSPEAIAGLVSALRVMREEMHLHAFLEETYIHPDYSLRVPGGARQLEEDHVIMHRHLDDLVVSAEQLAAVTGASERREAGQELYLAWNRFVAFYLRHINEEEEAVQPGLWRLFTEAELRQMFGRIMSAQTPEQLAGNLEMMLPAMSRKERAELAQSMADPPPAVLRMLDEAATRTLSPEDLRDFRSQLGLP